MHARGTSVRQASLRRAFVGPMVGLRLARARVLVAKFGKRLDISLLNEIHIDNAIACWF